MATIGLQGIYPVFRADDANGEPLEGGKIYSYKAGTSTPMALYEDAALTTPLPNPLVLNDQGEAAFYYGSQTYKLTLTDANDVPQWTIDPVIGTGGGGAWTAGIGFGRMTVEIRPDAGAAQAQALVFPPGVLAVAVTVWIETGFGTTQGLQAIGIGTPEAPDRWGYLTQLTAETETTAGFFQSYSGQPQRGGDVITLTAYGGAFDGTGTMYLTGHFCTFQPAHTVGYTYAPGGPTDTPPPLQATETQLGMTRYGTNAETIAGLLSSVATHPAGVQAALNAALATRQPLDATLTALASVTTGANTLAYFTALDTAQTTPLTAFGRSLLDDDDAAAGRSTLELGALATLSTVGDAELTDNAVSNTKLRDSAALSIVGRASNSSGDPADIVAASDNTILQRRGTSLLFGGAMTTATVTIGGLVSPTTLEVRYTRQGATVTLLIPTVSGVSNATTFNLTGLPTEIVPTSDTFGFVRGRDNGVYGIRMYRLLGPGNLVFYTDAAATAWTASGTKSCESFFVTYALL